MESRTRHRQISGTWRPALLLVGVAMTLLIGACTDVQLRVIRPPCDSEGRCQGDLVCVSGSCVRGDDESELTDGDMEADDTAPEHDVLDAEGLRSGDPCPGHPEMVFHEGFCLDTSGPGAPIPIGDLTCTGEGLAYVPGFCIDRYEASLSATPDCTGPFFGQAEGDIPPGFPDCVACDTITDPCTPGCYDPLHGNLRQYIDETEPVYACSLAMKIPAAWVSFYQANRACEHAGKRLCREAEWRRACSGPTYARDFPYPGEYRRGACIGWTTSRKQAPAAQAPRPGVDAPAETGSAPLCHSPEGVFDLAGNVEEYVGDAWVPYESMAGTARRCLGAVAGTYYQTLTSSPGCESTACFLDPPAPAGTEYGGFRCCL